MRRLFRPCFRKRTVPLFVQSLTQNVFLDDRVFETLLFFLFFSLSTFFFLFFSQVGAAPNVHF